MAQHLRPGGGGLPSSENMKHFGVVNKTRIICLPSEGVRKTRECQGAQGVDSVLECERSSSKWGGGWVDDTKRGTSSDICEVGRSSWFFCSHHHHHPEQNTKHPLVSPPSLPLVTHTRCSSPRVINSFLIPRVRPRSAPPPFSFFCMLYPRAAAKEEKRKKEKRKKSSPERKKREKKREERDSKLQRRIDKYLK